MSTPTEAHRDEATRWIVKRSHNVLHQIDSLAQLLSDSEARAVESARDEDSQTTQAHRIANTLLRERVRVLEEAINNAIDYAGGRESEWGDRAETSFGFLYKAIGYPPALATPERKEGSG